MNQELLEKCKNADLLKEVAKGKKLYGLTKIWKKSEDAMAKINITMAWILMMQRQDWRVLHLS